MNPQAWTMVPISERMGLLGALLLLFAVGGAIGYSGMARRSWPLVLAGLMVMAIPIGFAAAVFALDLAP